MRATTLFCRSLTSIIGQACAAASLVFILCTPAAADTPYVIYDSGPPRVSTGYISGIFWTAHDFTVESSSTVLALRLFLSYKDPQDLKGVTWEVYTDAGATPGSLLSGGTAVGTRALIGRANEHPYGTYQVDLTLPEILHLDPGRYWLAISTLGSSLDEPYIYWANSDSSLENSALPMMVRSFYGDGTWQPNWGRRGQIRQFDKTELIMPDDVSVAGLECLQVNRSSRLSNRPHVCGLWRQP
ncbi:MAG TPA: hypothetical protein VGE60_12050 [Telluria sp.]